MKETGAPRRRALYDTEVCTDLSLRVRRSEVVLILYFCWTAVLSVHFNLSPFRKLLAIAAPVLLWLFAKLASMYPRHWSDIARDWVGPALVLPAYWQIDWFHSGPRLTSLERSWLAADHTILFTLGLHNAIESLGPILPSVLELSYFLVYAIPAFAMTLLYVRHRRRRADAFLFPFLLGTLLAYALLPLFPSDSPRIEFPGLDLPGIMTPLRRLNIWILDHGDIHTSVFPSGHIASSFAAAIGLLFALPEAPWAGRALLIEALFISAATIYGRYHYAADIAASLLVDTFPLSVALLLPRWQARAPEPVLSPSPAKASCSEEFGT